MSRTAAAARPAAPARTRLALAMAFALAGASPAAGQPAGPHAVVAPPACANDRGETVRFVDRDAGPAGVAAGMAARDGSGNPVVYRSGYAAARPELQLFVDRHECAHHQVGDIDRPHPPRNGPEHLMNESIADCIAILRLRDEEGYDAAGFDSVAAALGAEMGRIGFAEISIASRIANIRHCFAEYGTPEDFIAGVLRQRRLRP